MPRPAIQYSVEEFKNLIERVEREGNEGKPFTSRSALYTAVADTDWAMERKMKVPFIYLQVKKHGFQLSTPLGERGRKKGAKVQGGKRKRIALDTVAFALKRAVPDAYHKLVDKANSGSMKAAIKLKCLDCCCFQRDEIRNCSVDNCSLYSFRPYKKENHESVC